MSMFTNKKSAEEVKKFIESRNNSKERAERVSPIYEAGNQYYEYLRESKKGNANDCDHCTAFMMF
ncbi:hypothetical protein [Clostridium thailandense]|uniref:Uncharacterized protein n=1 Tax=Clostridium thailandense TaxID=2794346 RepID=A0A949U028_9CLOT|nr:hypothetical protein [Clostridium thailandense]MBV7274840.1 hypothetical protein [Clostridium thailandense]MCH5137990.1 hypothetical protein [Clostridiaceae bacterium UIB06]